jgi:hypothetical protein
MSIPEDKPGLSRVSDGGSFAVQAVTRVFLAAEAYFQGVSKCGAV